MKTTIDFDQLGQQVLDVCRLKQWPLTWDHRGVYLHLEASELIEAVRSKRTGDLAKEGADLLFTFLAILSSKGVRFDDVYAVLLRKINKLDPLGETLRPVRLGRQQ